jgi:hypothetical protein
MTHKRRKARGKRRKEQLTDYEKAVLAKIDHDMAKGGVEFKPLDESLLRRIDDLVGDMDIDLDAPIEGPVDLGDPFKARVLPPSKTKH